MEEYLRPTEFLDFDKESVCRFAEEHSASAKAPEEKAIKLYYAVRDGFQYNPYKLDLRPEGLRASDLIMRDHGYCVEKAILLAASARAVKIPSRLSFYIVKNHIATDRLQQILATDRLVFHGAAELFLGGKWLKATPAFNKELCRFLGVSPLEFDGESDSIFQEFDHEGNTFMEYLHEYGAFSDMPYKLYLDELKKHYPHIFEDPKYSQSLVCDLTEY